LEEELENGEETKTDTTVAVSDEPPKKKARNFEWGGYRDLASYVAGLACATNALPTEFYSLVAGVSQDGTIFRVFLAKITPSTIPSQKWGLAIPYSWEFAFGAITDEFWENFQTLVWAVQDSFGKNQNVARENIGTRSSI